MDRTPQVIFEEHLAAVSAGDLDALAEGYTEDALLVTTEIALQGRAAIREFFVAALESLPGVRITIDTAVYAGDAVLLTWHADSPRRTRARPAGR
jgi:uncharacterized protein (TIGR02246 family)